MGGRAAFSISCSCCTRACSAFPCSISAATSFSTRWNITVSSAALQNAPSGRNGCSSCSLGVEETAEWTTGRIVAIRDLFDQTLARCRAKLPSKVYSKELVELIFTQPYCKIQFLVEAGIAKRQTASEYLRELERIGVLTAEKQGREVLYKYPALLKVLTA